jgi:zinc and cadmium transporter
MILLAILMATLAAGIGSVWLAAGLMRLGFRAPADENSPAVGPHHLLSLAAGALLATAFMHLLPEAFESGAGADHLFSALLIGLVFFFLLDKAELWHHGHEHHHRSESDAGEQAHAQHAHDQHDHTQHDHTQHDHTQHDHTQHDHTDHDPHHRTAVRSGGWAVLTGDSVHCFGDGILIASAFIADIRLGLVASLAVLAHEVPHHIGDLAVLRLSSQNRRGALVKVSLAGAVTSLGGLVGWRLVDRLHAYLPYFLVVASSSFVYVALADLIPQLQRRLSARATAAQVAWLLLGIALVTVVSRLAHSG